MDYQQTIQYLYAHLPVFTRVGQSAYKADLSNTLALCSRLNSPQHQFRSVHVAGTNGKGSTSHMLAAVLQTAGYKTGLYTSPHLKDFRERIRINGAMITEQEVIDFTARHRRDFDEIKPSFFEMTVAMAFALFAREKVDIAIIETGLGGRLDSTNVIMPLLSVITNIGWDHMNILGNTLELIASEKAGIIKPGIPVIIGERQPEVEAVFIEKASQEGCKITFASDMLQATLLDKRRAAGPPLNIEPFSLIDVKIRRLDHPAYKPADLQPANANLQLDLTGTYQLKNIKTVLCAIDELRQLGFVIKAKHLHSALSQVKTLTGLRGRWETIHTPPLTVCDTGHNPEGIAEVLQNIARVNYDQLHFVIGVVNDKDISKILDFLPKSAIYYFCKPDIPRGLDAEIFMQKAASFHLRGHAYPSVKAALNSAQQNAGKNDLVFVGGSTFVVAEVI